MTDPTSSISADRVGAKLKDDIFFEWRENMTGLLMAKKLWQYVEKDFQVDDANDQRARGYIWINVEHTQRSHVPAGCNARQMWLALCNKHEKMGPQVIANCIFGITYARGWHQDGGSSRQAQGVLHQAGHRQLRPSGDRQGRLHPRLPVALVDCLQADTDSCGVEQRFLDRLERLHGHPSGKRSQTTRRAGSSIPRGLGQRSRRHSVVQEHPALHLVWQAAT